MNNMMLATDNEELAASGNSPLEGAAAFLSYGIVSSLTSGGIGIYNTLKAGFNMFGADLSMTDETEAVREAFGRNTAQYYSENKVGADFGGLLASAVLTGGYAIGGLRALQAKGVVNLGYKNTLGLGNADVVLGSAQAQAYRTAVASKVNYTWRDATMKSALSVATKQNVAETLVAEGAFMLMNNQNALINPDQLDFIDSSVQIMKEGWMFAVGGAVFGTGIDFFRLKGMAARGFKEVQETGVTQDFRLITSELKTRTGQAGDKLQETVMLANAINTDPRFAAADAISKAAKVKATQQLDIMRDELIASTNNADKGGVAALHSILAITDDTVRMQALGNLARVENMRYRGFTEQVIRQQATSNLPRASDDLLRRLDSTDVDEVDAAIKDLREVNKARVSGNNAVMGAFQHTITRRKSSAEFYDELIRFASTDPEYAKRWESLKDAMAGTGRMNKDALKLSQQHFQQRTGIKIAGTMVNPAYAEDMVELLADIATRMGLKDSNVLAVQYPRLHGLISRTRVGAVQPFNTSTAVYNTRTGLLLANALPRAHDLGAVTMRNGIINIAGVPNSYVYRLDVVTTSAYAKALDNFTKLKTGEHPALEASAHWSAAALRGLDTTQVTSTDLPRIEAFVAGLGKEEVQSISVLMPDKSFVQMTQQEARQFLVAQKELARATLQAAGRPAEEIAMVLNTGEKFALGQSSDDVILFGKAAYDRAENVVLRYKNYGQADVANAARTFDGLAQRIETERGIRQRTSQSVLQSFNLGDISDRMPLEDMQLLKDISQTDSKATLISATHTRFASLRSWANDIGGMSNKAKDTLRQQTHDEMHGFYEHFSRGDNFAQRAELSFFVNAARTQDYMVIPLTDGSGSVAITKTGMQELIRKSLPPTFDDMKLAEQRMISMTLSKQVRDGLANKQGVDAMVAEGKGTAYLLSKEVGELVGWHMQRNRRYVANDKALANARGRTANRDPEVFYPPPVNVRRMPHVAFVRPLAKDADLPSYMLYAADAAELELKMAAIRTDPEMAGRYGVFQQDAVSAHKKAYGDYDAGRVFNEWDFNPDLRNKLRAGNLLPSGDAYSVETLDLLRNWHHNKAEHQYMSALELKYADTIDTLRSTDRAYKGQAVGAVAETKQASSIYESTVNLMLDKKNEGSRYQDLYNSVQDAFAVGGSQVLDAVGGALMMAWNATPLRKLTGARAFDTAEFDKLNDTLKAQGFENPYNSVETYLSRSANISDNRTAASLGRVLNTLVAGLTLRLDFLHSIVQVMSTPILLSGVMREAKVALRDADLARMTTVTNPANGVAEMSSMKLLHNAMKTLFSPQGKATAEEATKRGILQDYTRQYLEAADFTSLNGRHTLNDIQQKIDKYVNLGSKLTLHQLSEDFSRRVVMHTMMEIAEKAGLSGEAKWAMVRTGVDKVHGIYRQHSRVQLFNGVVGQSIGLFQTYMFNMAQLVTRGIQDGRTRDVAIMAVMQASLFGTRSLPAFNMVNSLVAGTNSGKMDIYTLAGTEHDPHGIGSYLLYGMGSHALQADAYSRGDIAIRHATVLPINPLDWPTVAMLGKSIGNIVDAGKAGMESGDWSSALAYGLAHNSLNRPLQGVGTWWQGAMTSSRGTPLFTDSNYNDYDEAAGYNWAALGARIIGGKPLNEAIAMDSYYRRTAYQTEQRNTINDLGESFRVAYTGGGELSEDAYSNFFNEYVSSGGQPEGFNAWVGRNIMNSEQGAIDKFKETLHDTSMGRLYGSMMAERRTVPLWEDDGLLLGTGQAQ